MLNRLKKLAAWGLYVLYVLLFILAVDYVFFYRPAMQELRGKSSRLMGAKNPETEPIATARHVDAELMKRLAVAGHYKTSAFTKYPKEKPPGVVRICAHGDSYTQGQETDTDLDYPSLLQKLFESQGAGNVEVVNFGMYGFGLQQSYMLWDAVARDFSCDFHLFGPRGFWAVRDTTFGALASWSPYYLHARYALEDGELELIEVFGDTYKERFEGHFAFLPRWRYWRYSRRAPMFLHALVPEGRELENPFYYDRRDMHEEARQMQQILLAKMLAEDAAPILIGHHRADVVAMADALAEDDLSAVQFPEIFTLPYLAPYSHAGPLGNQLAAELFHAQLTGRRGQLPILELADLDWSRRGAPPGKRRSIESYSKVELEIGGVPAGEIYIVGWAAKPLKVDGLVGLVGAGGSVLDSCFFPVDLELQPGMQLTLRLEQGGQATDYPLGETAVLPGGLNLAVVRVEGFKFWFYKEFEHLQDRHEPTPLTHGARRLRGLFFTGNGEVPLAELAAAGSEVTILLEDQPVLAVEGETMIDTEGLWLYPGGGHLRLARAKSGGLVDLAALPEEGEVELVVEHWEDGEVRVPIVRWHKRWIEQPQARRPLRKLVAVGDDGRAVVREAASGSF